jgi:DNA-binding transcriptional LysR family regulator
VPKTRLGRGNQVVDTLRDRPSNTGFGEIDQVLASIGRLPNLTHLRYFLAVGETLSFRQASEHLNVAQPAVTRAVQLLESEVGYRLLERTTRRVSLTPAGAHLFKEANAALAHLAAGVRDAKQYDLGTVGELAIAYAGVAPASASSFAAEFRRAYPEARVVMYMRTSQECSTLLQAGQIDVAFMLTAACSDALSHCIVRRHRFVAVLSKDHPLAERTTLALSELSDSEFVMGGQSRMRIFASLVDAACRNAGFPPKVVDEANDTTLLMQLVAQGRGVTLYGPEIVTSLPPGVVVVPLVDEAAAYDISIAWSARRETPLVKKFVELVSASARDQATPHA